MPAKKETASQAIKRRKESYGCHGRCYGGIDDNGEDFGICPAIDTCEETRFQEGVATLVAALVVLLAPIVLIVGIVALVLSVL